MRILAKEIDLRDETRQAEQVRPGLEIDVHMETTDRLASTQAELMTRVVDVTESLRELEEGEVDFEGEISLLTRVENVMGEAQYYLKGGNTGADSIAAETEAIELLMQSRRINPKSGGSAGGSSPGGGGAGTTEASALALLGTGAERNAKTAERAVSQTTGAAGISLPAEFQTGLDAFFDAIEKHQTVGDQKGL